MSALESFLLSGRAADLILLIVAAEGVALIFLRTRHGQSIPLSRWLSPLVAGAALVVALRLALTGGESGPMALALVVAGAAHVAGYRGRWQP